MKLLIMGPQGCGKGTVGSSLSDYLNVPIISIGQMLRDIPATHPWYKLINDQMGEGVLVDQAKVAQLLKERLSQSQYEKGFILDGWYRSMENVRLYEPEIDKAVLLNISVETTLLRLSNRRTCSECGQVYNTVSNPSQKGNFCDKCGGLLVQRDDDTKEAILKRLEVYRQETGEVVEYLRQKNLLLEVDGEAGPDKVFEMVKNKLHI